MNNERLFIKPTTPLAPTKEKKKLPSRSVLNASGGEKLFLSCSPQTMRLEFNIQVPRPVVDGVLSLLTSRNSDW